MKLVVAVLLPVTLLSLSAGSTIDDDQVGSAAVGAGLGAAAGAAVAAATGSNLLTGAVVGAAVGGVAGAVWSDRDRDGRADAYMIDGQYYPGTPDG